MKKIYQSPRACVYEIIGQAILVETSMTIGGKSPEGKVSNSNDIGFVKGERGSRNYDVWDENWNK